MTPTFVIWPVSFNDGVATWHLAIGRGPSQRTVDLPLDVDQSGFETQQRQPIRLKEFADHWLFRNKVVKASDAAALTEAELILHIKHRVLSEEQALEKMQRAVQAFENFERSAHTPREPISSEVRMFVWQRDGGRCSQCGSQDRLEYDHIIPLAKGGSNTERNIHLLCEACNRSKGANII